jgi:transaldolase/glucose-6-phosphate isomerase
MDTKGTIAEAERLWKDVKRKNLMVKVPATPEGLPAIEHLIGEGISINITLLFSQQVYREVAEAYLSGLEKCVATGGDPFPCRQRRLVLRQPHRQRRRQAARREDRQGQ